MLASKTGPGLLRQPSAEFTKHVYESREDRELPEPVYMFGSTIFLDEYDNAIDDTLCIRLIFPNTTTGRQLHAQKSRDFQILLDKFTKDTLLNNHILVPKYQSTTGNIYICGIDFYDKMNYHKHIELHTVSKYSNRITPNKNSLFFMLDCIIKGCHFLHTSGFFINTLSPTSILSTGFTRKTKNFLITDYSIIESKPDSYRIEMLAFIVHVLYIFEKYYKNIVDTLTGLRAKELAQITYIQSLLSPNHHLVKMLEQLQTRIQTHVVILQNRINTQLIIDRLTDVLIPALNETSTLDISPTIIYALYIEHIKPLIVTHGEPV
jgi:hypothetical protein